MHQIDLIGYYYWLEVDLVAASVVVALVDPFVAASWVASLVSYLVEAFAAVKNTYCVEIYKNHKSLKHRMSMKFLFSKW